MIEDSKLLKFYLGLTRRKREVLELTCRGLGNEQVGSALCISPTVVAAHLTEIYGRLGNVEELSGAKANRPLLISLFAPFLDRHPELRSDDLRSGSA